MEFRITLPEDCPPNISIPASGEMYRIVEKNPPTCNDFLTHREKFPETLFQNECEACGISVFKEKSDIYRLIKRIPSRRKRIQYIALGELNREMGMMANTSHDGDSHFSWWVSFGCKAWEIFNIIETVLP